MIIVINGPINSGKTTIGKHLSKKLPKSTFVDADFIVEEREGLELHEWIPLVIQETIRRGDHLISQGYENVIFSFPLYQEDYDQLHAHFGSELKCITLAPPLDECLKNRGDREILLDWELKRIKEMYKEGFHQSPFSDLTVDNSQQTPEETTAFIVSYLHGKGNKE